MAANTAWNGPFRLLDLPAELRVIIYGFALKEDGPSKMTRTFKQGIVKRGSLPGRPSPICIHEVNSPALTKICRLVREEALPVFLDLNVLQMTRVSGSDRVYELMDESFPKYHGSSAKKLGQTITGYLNAIKSIEIEKPLQYYGGVLLTLDFECNEQYPQATIDEKRSLVHSHIHSNEQIWKYIREELQHLFQIANAFRPSHVSIKKHIIHAVMHVRLDTVDHFDRIQRF